MSPKSAEQARKLEMEGTEMFSGAEKGEGRRRAIALKGNFMKGSIKHLISLVWHTHLKTCLSI